ncbi:hypothetical protein NMG60_11023965 [Bertholletia excelsa]
MLATPGDTGSHILVYPFPSPGHIIPLLDLTHLLLTRGMNVTFLVIPNDLPLLKPLLFAHPSTSFRPLLLSPPEPASFSQLGLVSKIRRTAELYNPLLHWFKTHPSPPVAILSDFFLGWSQQLAEDLGVPRVVFWASGAFTASISSSLWRNLPRNDEPGNDSFLIKFPEIPNSPVYPWWQITRHCRNFKKGDADYEFFREGMLANTQSWGVVFNSFTELERVYIDHVKKEMGHNRVWAVGPLLPQSDDPVGPANRGGSSAVATENLMAWLESKADETVVYVCFGSRTVLTSKQVEALAAALELSGVNFVWCVKAADDGRVVGDAEFLPDGFEDRVKERGLIIRGWAPQVSILRHRSVGAFVTHCGWNSTLEGVAAGVLMLMWPNGADQFTNTNLLVDQLGVAIRACEGGPQNVPDVEALTRLLGESVSANRPEKARAKQLCDAAWDAVKGGSSAKDLDGLVEQLNSLSFPKVP